MLALLEAEIGEHIETFDADNLIIQRLLAAGVYADQTLPGGETLLMTAARTGEPETVPSEPLAVRGGELHVVPVKNGPLKVRGPLEICCGTGRTVTRTQFAKLCRCGGSANKPFCDDTHLRIGFKSDQIIHEIFRSSLTRSKLLLHMETEQ